MTNYKLQIPLTKSYTNDKDEYPLAFRNRQIKERKNLQNNTHSRRKTPRRRAADYTNGEYINNKRWREWLMVLPGVIIKERVESVRKEGYTGLNILVIGSAGYTTEKEEIKKALKD